MLKSSSNTHTDNSTTNNDNPRLIPQVISKVTPTPNPLKTVMKIHKNHVFVRLMPFIITLVMAISLTSCGGDSSKEDTKAKHVEPWDYIPTDPALLSGKKIYTQECGLCHNEGEEGAPSLLSTATWKEREAKGMETLLKHAIEGWIGPDGEMPAKGGSDYLSDEQVTNAVKFMLAAYKTKEH